MAPRSYGDKGSGDESGRCWRWPIPGFRRSWSVALVLERVDLLEDLLVRREPVGRLIGIGGRPVDGHLEDAARAFTQAGGDAVLVLDRGLQTGGLGEVVSLPAVQDLDVHRALLSEESSHCITMRPSCQGIRRSRPS